MDRPFPVAFFVHRIIAVIQMYCTQRTLRAYSKLGIFHFSYLNDLAYWLARQSHKQQPEFEFNTLHL